MCLLLYPAQVSHHISHFLSKEDLPSARYSFSLQREGILRQRQADCLHSNKFDMLNCCCSGKFSLQGMSFQLFVYVLASIRTPKPKLYCIDKTVILNLNQGYFTFRFIVYLFLWLSVSNGPLHVIKHTGVFFKATLLGFTEIVDIMFTFF